MGAAMKKCCSLWYNLRLLIQCLREFRRRLSHGETIKETSRGNAETPGKLGSTKRTSLGAREQFSWYSFHGKRNEKIRENDCSLKKSKTGCN